MSDVPYKTYLPEDDIPTSWYNLRADMKNKPAPLLNPATREPCTAEELSHVFCEELVQQELDNDTKFFPIPKEISDFYKMYRPSPLVRAYFLEKALGTPAHIYYKFEGNNTSGSHKLNSSIAQAYYAKKQGLKGVTTETGAGQWGTALSMACAFFGLDCKVFMVKCSYEQKPFRREVMRTYGADVTPSPSDTTDVGRQILAEHPGTTGSLGCAISEAVEYAVKHEGYRYVLGSVLNQVLLHQSIIGLEAHRAFERLGVKPDVIIGCAGGGSNLGGLIAPFMGEKLRGEMPELHARRLRVRLLRHRPHLPAREDVHARRRLHPERQPRRRPALPRHEHNPLAAVPRQDDGGGLRGADCGLRGGGVLRPHRGHAPRARVEPRDPRGDRRGPALQAGGHRREHLLRPHRHGLLRPCRLPEVQRPRDDRPDSDGRRARRSAVEAAVSFASP